MVYILIMAGALILDQWTKHLAVAHLTKLDTWPLWQDVLHLTYAENTGAAFSILRGRQGLLAGFTGLVILLMGVYMVRESRHMSRLANVAFSLVIGGALGNLIDRIRLGYVVDFIDFRLIDFAIFNAADSCIVVGALLMGYAVLFDKA